MEQAGNQRVREQTKSSFLAFSQKLKVIFRGFAMANHLDKWVAEVKRILSTRSLS